VLIAVEPQPGGEIGVGRPVEKGRRPAQRRRGVPQRGEGVTRVELAIAEGPLAVLPGLAPGDRGQADEERPRGQCPGKPGGPAAVECTATLEAVVAADVVVDA